MTRPCGHGSQVGMYVSMRDVHKFVSRVINRFFDVKHLMARYCSETDWRGAAPLMSHRDFFYLFIT